MTSMISLNSLANRISGAQLVGGTGADANIMISGITHDSRKVRPGDIFAALKGETTDGTRFVDSAVKAGAAAVLCETPLETDIPQIVVQNARARLGEVAAVCYGNPSDQLKLIGITGTNGKTTTTYLLETILQHAGLECGVMGTVEYRYGAKKWHAEHTTPEATIVQSTIRSMVDAGANALAMEVSSHGLVQGRLNGCEFDVVAFSNLTQDHLDYHHTMAEYGAAKMQLFTEMIAHRPLAKVVVNLDDDFSHQIVAASAVSRHEIVSVSISPDSDATLRPATPPVYQIDETTALIHTPEGDVAISSHLCGAHNLSNVMLAFGICRALGVSGQNIADAVARILSVPGRLERVACDLDFSVFVDYAHTPDALVNVLRVLKPLTRGRLICLFGCGGDRDNSKRPLMGEAVAKYADIAVVTSDNPRTEDPAAIIEMVIPGVTKHQQNCLKETELPFVPNGYIAIEERRAAIEKVIGAAQPDDSVLIAGKGHEDYVIIGTEKHHFDDREEAARAIASRKG